jgi:homoserine kinase
MNGGTQNSGCMRLRLPATSANLGPGFDAVAVALNFFLEMEAEPAAEFSIRANGRNAERCARLDGNLVLETYCEVLEQRGRKVVPLAIQMVNGIPLGMGCGSSAAGRLAAIALANRFGELEWSTEQIIEEGYRREGHPDNVAACWLGGLVAAASQDGHVRVVQVEPPEQWRAIVVLPARPLATSEARAVLPPAYPREDVVANIQAAALLGLAFALGRGELLRAAMSDRIHQPYRAPFCPLLEPLLPLVGGDGILGVALSGAGPAVLVVVEDESKIPGASERIRRVAENVQPAELVVCRFLSSAENSPVMSGGGEDFVCGGIRNLSV